MENKEINLYCDESNHLKHNRKIMTLGYIECLKNESHNANIFIRKLKEKHGLNKKYEIKWTKVSASKIDFYKELILFFLKNENMKFRCIIANKENIDYDSYKITHDDWYYRMYYLLLGKTLKETNQYNIYLDIKDTCSKNKIKKLKEVLQCSYYDFSQEMIKKIQHVHSHELELIQLTDLLIGAIGYKNNSINTSSAKLKLIEIIEQIFGNNLLYSTSLATKKFNIFKWEGR